jgi:glucose 1-dehydrogenase
MTVREMFELNGRVALVTGGSRGLGLQIASALGEMGARIAISARKAQELVEARNSLEAKGIETFTVVNDLAQPEQALPLTDSVASHYGTIDILVNNAGLQQDAALVDMTLQQWNTVIGINLTGQFLCAREAAKEFLRRGVKPEVSVSAGKIICMSSVHDVIPWAGHVNYASSKGGIMMMMKSMAQELAPWRIRVLSVCPGAIRTPINTEAWTTPEAYSDLMKLCPYNRIGEPEDIASVTVMLASDLADYVNGINVYVDGGMTLYPGFEAGG